MAELDPTKQHLITNDAYRKFQADIDKWSGGTFKKNASGNTPVTTNQKGSHPWINEQQNKTLEKLKNDIGLTDQQKVKKFEAYREFTKEMYDMGEDGKPGTFMSREAESTKKHFGEMPSKEKMYEHHKKVYSPEAFEKYLDDAAKAGSSLLDDFAKGALRVAGKIAGGLALPLDMILSASPAGEGSDLAWNQIRTRDHDPVNDNDGLRKGSNTAPSLIADRGGDVPSYLQPTAKSGGGSKGGNSTDTPSGGTANANYISEATTKGKGGYQPTTTTTPTKTTTTTKTDHPNVKTSNPSSTKVETKTGYDSVGTPNRGKTESSVRGPRPVVLDLDNDGIELTELSRSTTFMDADGDGLVQRTAWAGAGDGVLFYDAGNDGLITESREYIFTEWDPTATSDLKALKAAFDTNGDSKLTAADAEFAKFKVMVTNADGTQQAMTLAELGITEINLNAAVALVTLPDGSKITGTATFLMNGQNRTLADTVLAAEAQGYRIEKSATVNGSYTLKAYDASGNLAYSITNTTSANGLAITNLYDDNGDGVVDRIQTIDTTINVTTGARTETLINKLGNVAASANLQNKTVTTSSADGKQVTIQRDTSGGGWYDQVETRTRQADNSHTNITSNFAKDGTTLLSKATETINSAGNIRVEDIDADGLGGANGYEIRITETITETAGIRTTTIVTTNRDGTLRTQEKEVIAANGRDKVISRDRDGTFETIEDLDVTVNPDNTRTNVLDVRNADGTLRTITNYMQSANTLMGEVGNDNEVFLVNAA
jgi:hypothetical protein